MVEKWSLGLPTCNSCCFYSLGSLIMESKCIVCDFFGLLKSNEFGLSIRIASAWLKVLMSWLLFVLTKLFPLSSAIPIAVGGRVSYGDYLEDRNPGENILPRERGCRERRICDHYIKVDGVEMLLRSRIYFTSSFILFSLLLLGMFPLSLAWSSRWTELSLRRRYTALKGYWLLECMSRTKDCTINLSRKEDSTGRIKY